MKFNEYISQLLDMNWGMVEMAMDGLTPEELSKMPTDDSNSIAWLMWHTARDEDYLISLAEERPQLWVSEGWHDKFGIEPGTVDGHDFKDIGVGSTAKEVASFKTPDAGVIIGYYLAAREATKKYLENVSPEDLDREMPDPWSNGGKTTLVTYINCIVDEALAHGGQVAMLRGLHRGMGWFG